MTVDASRSCLGLGTCVGSATRQIVVARVLLTATAPPALPGGSMSGGSLAPPCDAITGFLRSASRRRHALGDGGLLLLPKPQFAADPGREAIGPVRLDEPRCCRLVRPPRLTLAPLECSDGTSPR